VRVQNVPTAWIGFEIVLTHWFYLYIPWFFPFVAVPVIASGRQATA